MDNALVSYYNLFRDIPAADAALIAVAVESRYYKEGDILFKEGRVCKEMFFICSGVLRVVNITEEGNEVTHFFLKENQFCCILNSFTNNLIAHESIAAASDAHVLCISKAALDALYKQLPYLQTLMGQITQQALIDKIAIRNALLGLDSASRYRTFMVRQPEVALRVSQGNIASYLGMTPQSLSRIRKNMR